VFVPLRIVSDAVAWPHLTCFGVVDVAAAAVVAAAFVVAASAVDCLIRLTRTIPHTLLLEVAEGSFQGNQQSSLEDSQQYNHQGCQDSS